MSFSKNISPSNSTPANGLASRSTQQLPPQQLPSSPKSQSHSTQKQQRQPDLPWSVLCPTFCHSKDDPRSTLRSPFPRHGHTLCTTAAGELLFFGGYASQCYHPLRNDLYVFSTRDCSVTLLKTSGEAPSPRTMSTGVLAGDVLLIWGGVTKLDGEGKPKGPYDDSLYLLSLVSRVWTRVVVNDPGPYGRCRHAVTMVGSKLFIFGGRTDSGCSNDMWALDLNSLQSKPVWDSYDPAPGNEMPPPRNGHVLVTTGDRIILFGGADSAKRYNDTWSFDVSTRKWTELQCTGSIPSPRNNHAAALVGDVMYVFGGRDVDNRHLGDLIGLKLSIRQWFRLQNMGPSPSGRWSHAMVSNGTRVFVIGGNLEDGAQADESALIHVLETKHVGNPKPYPDFVKPDEKTTQPALESSAGLSTREHAQCSTSPSSDARAASPFQISTEELGYPAFLQITRDSVVSEIPDGLRSQLKSVNGKTRVDPENLKDDDDEGLAEYLPDFSSEREVTRLECERVVELERQLLAMLAAQTERDQRLTELTEELAQKSALLERAEANAAEAKKRAGLEPRELADRLHAQSSLEHKDAVLVRMQAKLDELVVSRDHHVRALGQAQSALQKATSRAADADKYETELVEVRAELKARTSELEGKKFELEARKSELETKKSELEARKSELEARKSELEARKSEQEARKSELEAIRLRLTDAENGWAKSKAEADTLRALSMADLVSTDEDRTTRGLLERIRAMEAEMASLRWSEKSLEAMETRNEG